jgi:protein-disulfide isomerase
MRATVRLIALAAATTLSMSFGVFAEDQLDSRAGNPKHAATFSTGSVSNEEFEAASRGRLIALRTQQFNLQWRILNDLLAERIISERAAAEGVAVADFLKRHVEDTIGPISEQEVQAAYDLSPQQFSRLPKLEASARIAEQIRQRRIAERRRSFIEELKREAKISTNLEPPRLTVPSDGPALGPSNAAITVVEFSDYHCPYCAQARSVLKRLLLEYGANVRLVFRDYPLNQAGPKAAQAAHCAGEQGRYWEMHDRLFENQQHLQLSELAGHARAIGLDGQVFDECLASDRYVARLAIDKREAQLYGVSATPTLFVNGRLLVGAPDYDALKAIVDDELMRLGATPSAMAARDEQGTK